MRLSSTALVLAAGLSDFAAAVPIQDSPRQRLLDGKPLPAKYRKSTPSQNPYTPDYKDPYDKFIDAVGDGLDPLPWRNGEGASVLGPWNRERSRQNPDLVRPPSTDHGDMPNLRWSFADSHIRIEVCYFPNPSPCRTPQIDLRPNFRKAAGRGRPPSASSPPASSSPPSTCASAKA